MMRNAAESPPATGGDGVGQFTEVQLAQLRDVFRDAIEDTVRGIIRSEFDTLTGQVLGRSASGLRRVGPGMATPPASKTSQKAVETSPKLGTPGDTSAKTGSEDALAQTSSEKQSQDQQRRESGASDSTTKSDKSTKGTRATTEERLRAISLQLVHGAEGNSDGRTTLDIVMSCVILANCVLIAFQTHCRVEETVTEPHYLLWMEAFFLFCFIFELAVHLIADGLRNLSSAWFWFDLILVVIGVISWLTDVLRKTTTSLADMPYTSQLLALRVLRLFRIVRALRRVQQFKELWKLCSGLAKSAGTMLSVWTVILVAIFVFGCLGVEVITSSDALAMDPETDEIVKKHFSSLSMTLLTLTQFANADSIGAIYVPLCRVEPFLMIYFLALWLLVYVALMNLVTAIIVEAAMSQEHEAAEKKAHELRKLLRKILPDIEDVFRSMDTDRSGSVSIKEIEAATITGSLALPNDIRQYVAPEKLLDMFELLDVNQSGEIDKAEFVDGVCTLVVSSVPIETTQILQLLRQTNQVLRETQAAVGLMVGDRVQG